MFQTKGEPTITDQTMIFLSLSLKLINVQCHLVVKVEQQVLVASATVVREKISSLAETTICNQQI